MRNCSKCGEEFPETRKYFCQRKTGKYVSECRKCVNEANKLWRRKNRDEVKEYNKKYLINNKERLKLLWQEYRNKNRKKINKHKKEYKQTEHYQKVNREWRAKPKNKLCKNVSSRISNYFSCDTASKTFQEKMGYSLNDLKKHLEKQFKNGMSWDNYGCNGWHVDHICPVSSFSYESYNDDAFKKCWSLDNLQPLWALDNLKKSNKIMGSN